MTGTITPVSRSLPRRGGILLLLAPACLHLAACSGSAGTLANSVADAPGVVAVDVTEASGDDDIPFTNVQKTVHVAMEADATADEISRVFDAFDEAIDDGDVTAVEVTLNDGTKNTALASGEGVHATRSAVDDLVAAQADEDVLAYRRQAYPVLPSVDLEIASSGIDAVVSAADRYRDVDDLESVTVRSGAFLLIRDEVNGDLRVTSARERLASRVAANFRLLGATVSGRGPLELTVEATDRAAVRQFATRNAPVAAVRRIVVIPGA